MKKLLILLPFFLASCSLAPRVQTVAVTQPGNSGLDTRVQSNFSVPTQEMELDPAYPGKRLLKLKRGKVTMEESEQYLRSLLKKFGGKDHKVIKVEKLAAKTLKKNKREFAALSIDDDEQMYELHATGEFTKWFPNRDGSVVSETYKRYIIVVREKDGWLMSEQLLKD